MIPVGDYRYERIHPAGQPPCWVLFPNSPEAADRPILLEQCDKHRMEFLTETGLREMDCPRCRFERMEKEQVRAVRQRALDQQANAAARDRFDIILKRDWKALVTIGCIMVALVAGVMLARLSDQGQRMVEDMAGTNERMEAVR